MGIRNFGTHDFRLAANGGLGCWVSCGAEAELVGSSGCQRWERWVAADCGACCGSGGVGPGGS